MLQSSEKFKLIDNFVVYIFLYDHWKYGFRKLIDIDQKRKRKILKNIYKSYIFIFLISFIINLLLLPHNIPRRHNKHNSPNQWNSINLFIIPKNTNKVSNNSTWHQHHCRYSSVTTPYHTICKQIISNHYQSTK